MGTIILALGLVLIFEGFLFVIAPDRVEDLLEHFRQMPVEARRLVGLIALTVGLALISMALALA
ncbi:DUF2065 domain-containing protein [Palleronia abyssalis]|uniref:Inner membrane protein YjeT n=1 Tax=Palleronia abyssalis TaxID=1501240 RepID=A0A2R8BXA5_9RHOB|nr:DUF2065 domain-containing protein [Palleronia abyssalis]SPJ24807.1 hypothetical protein PAA8504_02646 [Palleronia abyssalis]